MLPTLTIDTYTLNIILIFLVGSIISFFYQKKITKGVIKRLLCLLVFIVSMVVGGKLLYSLETLTFDFYLGHYYINGAVAFMPFAFLLMSKIFKIKLRDLFYVFTPIVAFVIAEAKVGCFLAGCCLGIPMEGGLVFPSDPLQIARFPVQILQFIVFYIFMGLLFFFNRKESFHKYSYPLYFCAYNFLTFFFEFLLDNDKIAGAFSLNQFISIGLFVAGLVWLVFVVLYEKKKLPWLCQKCESSH